MGVCVLQFSDTRRPSSVESATSSPREARRRSLVHLAFWVERRKKRLFEAKDLQRSDLGLADDEQVKEHEDENAEEDAVENDTQNTSDWPMPVVLCGVDLDFASTESSFLSTRLPFALPSLKPSFKNRLKHYAHGF